MGNLINKTGGKFFVAKLEFESEIDAIAHIKLSIETRDQFIRATHSSSFHKFQNTSVEEFREFNNYNGSKI